MTKDDIRYLIAKEMKTTKDGLPINSIYLVTCYDGSWYAIKPTENLEKRYHNGYLTLCDWVITHFDKNNVELFSTTVNSSFRLAQAKMIYFASEFGISGVCFTRRMK